MDAAAITVTGLAITPVKAMRLQTVSEIELGPLGARGNRRFYLIDDRSRLVNGKHVKTLQQVVARYDDDAGTLALDFPDGSCAEGTIELGEILHTRFFSTEHEVHEVRGPWAEALSAFAGRPLRLVAPDTAVDRGLKATASLMSRGSLRRLAEVAETDAVDARRFRMLIEIDGVAPHAEDAWVGRRVRVGEALIGFHGHIGRCAITTRDPETAETDLPTLQLLKGYRGDVEATEPLPFGVYGEVLEPGAVRLGDSVRPVS